LALLRRHRRGARYLQGARAIRALRPQKPDSVHRYRDGRSRLRGAWLPDFWSGNSLSAGTSLPSVLWIYDGRTPLARTATLRCSRAAPAGREAQWLPRLDRRWTRCAADYPVVPGTEVVRLLGVRR